MEGPSGFQSMMQEAVRIRQAMDATLRVSFDSYPPYIQATLFATEEVRAAREEGTAFEERMGAAERLKREGNEAMRESKWMDASTKYEQALGCFTYLKNRHPDWKKRGIKDEDITLRHYGGRTQEERDQVKRFCAACYLNIALVNMRLNHHSTAVQACSSALDVDPGNVKALYRRAKARSEPPSAGATEIALAIRDLEEAASLESKNREVLSMLRELKAGQKRQNEADKKAFGGLFERGCIVKDVENRNSAVAAESSSLRSGGDAGERFRTRRDLVEYIEELERTAREAADDERTENELVLREKIIELRKILAKVDEEILARKKSPDWQNPTPEMVERAAQDGIDLKDEATVRLIEKLQREENRDTDDKADEIAVSSDGEQGGGMDLREMKEMIGLMRQAEVMELLTCLKTKKTLIMACRGELSRLRDLATSQLDSLLGPTASQDVAKSPQMPKWQLTLICAAITVIWKLFSLGIIKNVFSDQLSARKFT